MKHSFLYCVLALVICFSSCGKKEKVISRGDMAKIYAEMFVADQRLGKNNQIKRMADTSFVYEPIFNKYGYTTEDFRNSMAYYINDATRYARILRQSSLIIEKELKDLREERDLIELAEAARDISRFYPEKLFNLTGLKNPDIFEEENICFYVDSTGGDMWFDVRVWNDTAFFGPEMVIAAENILSGEEDLESEEVDENSEIEGVEEENGAMLPVEEAIDSVIVPGSGLVIPAENIVKDAAVASQQVADSVKTMIDTVRSRRTRPVRPKREVE